MCGLTGSPANISSAFQYLLEMFENTSSNIRAPWQAAAPLTVVMEGGHSGLGELVAREVLVVVVDTELSEISSDQGKFLFRTLLTNF